MYMQIPSAFTKTHHGFHIQIYIYGQGQRKYYLAEELPIFVYISENFRPVTFKPTKSIYHRFGLNATEIKISIKNFSNTLVTKKQKIFHFEINSTMGSKKIANGGYCIFQSQPPFEIFRIQKEFLAACRNQNFQME